jgi:hypothetical protein
MCMAQRRNLSIGVTVNLENYENLRLEVSGEVCGDGDEEELITYLDTILSRLGRGTPETAERVDSYRKRVFTPPAAPASPKQVGEALPLQREIVEPPASVPTLSSAPAPATAIPQKIKEASAPTAPSPIQEPAASKEIVSPAVQKETSPPASPIGKKAAVPVAAPVKEAPLVAKKEVAPPARKETVPPAPVVLKEVPAPEVSPKTSSPPAPAGSGKAPKDEEFSCERCGEPITPVQRKLSRMFQNKDLCKKCLQQL